MPQDDTEGLVSIRAAARELAITPSTLIRQVASGQIRSHDGKVRISEVVADRAANVDATRSHRRKPTVSAPDSSPDSSGPDATAPAAPDAPSPFHLARTDKEAWTARLRRLEFEQKEGRLVDAERVRTSVFAIAREERDAWVNWPARVAPLMAATLGVDAVALAVELERHVRDHLSERALPRLRLAG